MTSLSHIKNLILDADGVLWCGDTPIPGLHEFIDTLNQKGIGFVVATNNASKTSMMYTERFKRYGIDVSPEQVVPSAEATASYLREEYPAGTAVFPVGEKGLHDALLAQGFTLVSEEEALTGAKAELVVVGFNRHATYQLMAMGAHLINQGARFIGTNPDPSYPSERGPMPGAGALLAFIQASTGVKPTIIGKPGPIMFQQAVKRLGGTLENTAMVGDRLTTDILGAHNIGLNTILVLSGVSKLEDVKIQNIKPDFIFADIREITAALP
ncbi:MAG: haloacid dehalogenase [Chloroflexi bacterium]|nr:MAG: haloacid dehalogenase [Chloroflexota bacterium]PIE81656.1 MAG: haloacid dehalogenase [Chloroflexota bacterium]